MHKMNVLVTLDENYIPYHNVMLTSLIHSNPNSCFDVYLLHSSVSDKATEYTKRILGPSGRLISVQAKDIGLDGAPTTSRYPQEIYYRIFAARYLPQDLDRVLYKQHAPFEKSLNLDWIRNHSVIIYYCGRNKPWKSNYFGELDVFYKETVSRMERLQS